MRKLLRLFVVVVVVLNIMTIMSCTPEEGNEAECQRLYNQLANALNNADSQDEINQIYVDYNRRIQELGCN